jgi:hypothetical protein
MSKPWTPTHVITLENPDQEASRVRVMLVPIEEGYAIRGPAYTKEEWEAEAPADWVLHVQKVTLQGIWLFQGRPAPTDNTTVTVEEVSYCRVPSYLARSLLQALVNTACVSETGDLSAVLRSLVGELEWRSSSRGVPEKVSQSILNGNLNTGGGHPQVVGWLVELLEAANQKKHVR